MSNDIASQHFHEEIRHNRLPDSNSLIIRITDVYCRMAHWSDLLSFSLVRVVSCPRRRRSWHSSLIVCLEVITHSSETLPALKADRLRLTRNKGLNIVPALVIGYRREHKLLDRYRSISICLIRVERQEPCRQRCLC